MRQACLDRVVAEKRQQAAMLVFEAASLAGNETEQEHERERARTFLDVMLDATARAQEHSRRALLAEE
jgi:hypothetical protein